MSVTLVLRNRSYDIRRQGLTPARDRGRGRGQSALVLRTSRDAPCCASRRYFEAACFLMEERFNNLLERFDKLESSVAAISEHLKTDTAGRRLVDTQECADTQPQPFGESEVGASSDLQTDFKSIRESLAKVRLPPDLVVGDSRAGVSKADWPKFQVIQKCARYQETVLKLFSQCTSREPVLSELSTIAIAQLRYLQEEYTNLLVANQFDDGTTRLFQTLQQNPAAFTPGALENLQRAVSIAGARHNRQVSGSGRFRGRGSFFPFASGGPGRGYRLDAAGQRPGGGAAGSGSGSADWRFRRGRFGYAPGPRDLAARAQQPDDVTGTFSAE